jgi:hypothetical protein
MQSDKPAKPPVFLKHYFDKGSLGGYLELHRSTEY